MSNKKSRDADTRMEAVLSIDFLEGGRMKKAIQHSKVGQLTVSNVVSSL